MSHYFGFSVQERIRLGIKETDHEDVDALPDRAAINKSIDKLCEPTAEKIRKKAKRLGVTFQRGEKGRKWKLPKKVEQSVRRSETILGTISNPKTVLERREDARKVSGCEEPEVCGGDDDTVLDEACPYGSSSDEC